jgi:hypothetical protein
LRVIAENLHLPVVAVAVAVAVMILSP